MKTNIDYLLELEEDAELGRAIKSIFGFSENDDYIAQCNKTHEGQFVITGEIFGSFEDIIDYVKGRSK